MVVKNATLYAKLKILDGRTIRMSTKCFHCEIEYEKPKAPDCWATHATQSVWCKKCRAYMLECAMAWNKAHGLHINGEPPGVEVTKKDLWTAYHNKMGDYPMSPGIQIKGEENV